VHADQDLAVGGFGDGEVANLYPTGFGHERCAHEHFLRVGSVVWPPLRQASDIYVSGLAITS
jgi:hypothetical protein